MGMESKYKDPKKKEQLIASFDVVAKWAQDADPNKFSNVDLDKMAQAADEMKEQAHAADPARAFRYASHLVVPMDKIIDLQKDLKSLPTDDADRTNPQLRTALRRIEEIRKKDVWHVQLT